MKLTKRFDMRHLLTIRQLREEYIPCKGLWAHHLMWGVSILICWKGPREVLASLTICWECSIPRRRILRSASWPLTPSIPEFLPSAVAVVSVMSGSVSFVTSGRTIPCNPSNVHFCWGLRRVSLILTCWRWLAPLSNIVHTRVLVLLSYWFHTTGVQTKNHILRSLRVCFKVQSLWFLFPLSRGMVPCIDLCDIT